MYELAIKKIFENRIRSWLTIMGISIAMIVMIIGLYYLYIGNKISYEQLAKVTSEQRILYNQVDIYNTSYYEKDGDMIAVSSPVNEAYIKKLASYNYVKDIVCCSELDTQFYMDFDNYKFIIDMPRGVDVNYSTFSRTLIDVADVNKSIVAGEDFNEKDERAAIISESTLSYMGIQPNEIIGESIKVTNQKGENCNVVITGVFAHELSVFYAQEVEDIGSYIESGEYDEYGMDIIFTNDVIEALKDKDESAFNIKISIDDISKLDLLIKEIKNNSPYTCVSDYLLYYESVRSCIAYNRLIISIGIIIAIISMLLILSTITLNISDQKRTVKIFSYLGMTEQRIGLYFVFQGLFFLISGSLLGSVIGYVITLFMGSNFASTYSEIIESKLFIFPPYYVVILILIIIVVSLVISCFSMILIMTINRIRRNDCNEKAIN